MKCFLCDFMGYEVCKHCRKNTQPANRGYFFFLQLSQTSYLHEFIKKAFYCIGICNNKLSY